MNNFTLKKEYLIWLKKFSELFKPEQWIAFIAAIAAVAASVYSFKHGYTIAYGDAESHLNIAKRVVSSITPGFAQLGGIWLPLPHILLIPFVWFDPLWRTGIAGSIVSGICYIVSSVYIYKLVKLITKHAGAAFFGALVFALNLNILYMQSTPMTELVLIVFFILSTYFFVLFMYDDSKFTNLVIAGFFTFCASLSRYDGWGLALMEAGVLILYYWPSITKKYEKLEGRFLLFALPAFFGIFLWLGWGWLILGDPLYFTHSEFSAKSQQNSWLTRGELPAYKNIIVSIVYYLAASLSNVGIVVSVIAVVGLIIFILDKKMRYKLYTLLILLVPFIFNIATLYLGQSVIFIPSVTPITFEWRLFNVRYGLMVVPFAAVFAGYLFSKMKLTSGKAILFGIFAFSFLLYGVGYAHVIDLQDGTIGLSSGVSKLPDAQNWLEQHYDYGLILTDDFARTISLVRIPKFKMQSDIYIGNKPYWEESLVSPEKYARWIVMQKNDAIWTSILDNPVNEARLYKYFNKVYTSDNILIFRRIND